MPSPFLRHGQVGGVPSGSDTSSFLKERGVTGVRAYQEDVLQGAVKQLGELDPLQWLGMGLAARLFLSKNQDVSSCCGGTFRFLSAPRIGPRGVQTSTPRGYKLWAVLEDMACQKRHNNLDSVKRSPWRRCVPQQQSGRSVSRLASKLSAATLSGIIINNNLKPLLKNYLARKVDVLFHFPSGSQYTWDNLLQNCVQDALQTKGTDITKLFTVETIFYLRL